MVLKFIWKFGVTFSNCAFFNGPYLQQQILLLACNRRHHAMVNMQGVNFRRVASRQLISILLQFNAFFHLKSQNNPQFGCIPNCSAEIRAPT
jgi:hypothetical protein